MTTILSSKGQVVVPRSVRAKLGLQAGTQFDVRTEGNTVVLAPKNIARGKVKLRIDRKTGLPTLIPPAGTPPMTSEMVRNAMADFP